MKIGIYGGTFSPPHNGHIKAADTFMRAERLDKLLIIPTFIPPHKSEDTPVSPEDRLEMCRLAFENRGYIVSDTEIRRGGKSYTYDTLTELAREYRGDELLLLCGTDMLLTFDKWYRFADIFRLCTVVCMRRERDEDGEVREKLNKKIAEFREQHGADIRLIDADPIEVSSTEVRKLIACGGDAEGLIPIGVYDYMRQKGLYKNV